MVQKGINTMKHTHTPLLPQLIYWLGRLESNHNIMSELELFMEEHMTECNQACDFLSKLKLMSFVNIDF